MENVSNFIIKNDDDDGESSYVDLGGGGEG